MPRRTWSWVARPITTILMTMVLAAAGITAASPASANVAAPQQIDRCGTIFDQFVIPNPGDGTTYEANGKYVAPGVHYVYGPVGPNIPTVEIIGYGVSVQSWKFDFTDVPCPPSATDTVSIIPGVCDPSTGFTSVTVPYNNVDDATDQPRKGVVATFTRVDFSFQHIYGDVLDGEQVLIGTGYDRAHSTGARLLPGTWTVDVRSEGLLVASASKFIAKCGDDEVPAGDPSGAGESTDSGPVVKPSGKLKQIRGTTKMRAIMVNKRVSTPTKFRLVINKPGPGKIVKVFKVAPGGKKVKTRRAPVRTVFVLKALVRTVKADGQVVSRMTLLKRTSLRAVRR